MATTQQVDPVVANAQARSILQNTALPIRKRIASRTDLALGQVYRQRLNNTGLTTGVQLRVSFNVTTTGTTTQGQFGAYSFVPRVTLTDYNQIERVSSDAFSLQLIRGFKRRRFDDLVGTGYIFPGNPSVHNFANFPTGTLTNQEVSFFIDVPFCVDTERGDTRGLSLSQTVVGEQFVEIKIADALIDPDPTKGIFSAATTAVLVGNVRVEVYQEYLQPQNMASLPMMDLSTIYEIKGLFRSTSDIATNAQKLLNYPNVRTVFSSTHLAIDNNTGVLQAGLPSIQLLANSSQILQEHSLNTLRRWMVDEVQGDYGQGVIFFNHRNFPISTSIYGNVQLALNWGTITGGNTFTLSTYESIYASGTPLPGISTQ
jgi:hypothetical protein